VAILVFVYKLLQRYQLESLAYLFALAAVASLILMPITSFFQTFSDPATGQRVRRTRVIGTLLAAATLLVALCLIPVPSRVRVPIRVEAAGAQRVYVSEPGMLVQAIELGQPVKAGQTLAVLRSLDLQRDVARLEGEIRRTRIQLENLTTLRALAPELAAEVAPLIPATEESLRDKIAQHQQLHSNQSRLRVTAPIAGVVLPGPAVATHEQADELPAWSGLPLQEMNLGCQLDRGTTLCLISQPGRYEVLAYIPQDQVERVRTGQSVRLLLDQLAGQQLTGTVQTIAKVDALVVPEQVVRDLDLPVRKDTTGALRPVGTIYEARIAFAQSPANLVVGGRGRAKILVDPQTVAQRLYRSLSSIFSFEL
jgi:hypothetical protein